MHIQLWIFFFFLVVVCFFALFLSLTFLRCVVFYVLCYWDKFFLFRLIYHLLLYELWPAGDYRWKLSLLLTLDLRGYYTEIFVNMHCPFELINKSQTYICILLHYGHFFSISPSVAPSYLVNCFFFTVLTVAEPNRYKTIFTVLCGSQLKLNCHYSLCIAGPSL